MRALKRVSALALFLLVGGQFMLLPGQAYAWCCGLCQCSTGCTCYPDDPIGCPMAGPCRSIDASQGKPVTTTVTIPEVNERLMDLARGGTCARNKFTGSLLRSAGDLLKFEPVSFDEKIIESYTVSF